jgi:hypothetical protein
MNELELPAINANDLPKPGAPKFKVATSKVPHTGSKDFQSQPGQAEGADRQNPRNCVLRGSTAGIAATAYGKPQRIKTTNDH